jgi:hypothetical protein
MELLDIKFYKRLESFAPWYSQFLLLADFEENCSFLWFKKPVQKIREIKRRESIHEQHFVERKNEGRKTDKAQVWQDSSLRRLEFIPRNLG